MAMAIADANWVAVLVAGIINMVVGAVWYMPSVFGKIWAQELGMKMDGKMEGMASGYGITFIGALVMSLVLDLVIKATGAADASTGIMAGIWLWLGFAVTLPLNDVVFGKKTWKLYMLNAAYYLVVLVINGALLANWK